MGDITELGTQSFLTSGPAFHSSCGQPPLKLPLTRNGFLVRKVITFTQNTKIKRKYPLKWGSGIESNFRFIQYFTVLKLPSYLSSRPPLRTKKLRIKRDRPGTQLVLSPWILTDLSNGLRLKKEKSQKWNVGLGL